MLILQLTEEPILFSSIKRLEGLNIARKSNSKRIKMNQQKLLPENSELLVNTRTNSAIYQ